MEDTIFTALEGGVHLLLYDWKLGVKVALSGCKDVGSLIQNRYSKKSPVSVSDRSTFKNRFVANKETIVAENGSQR